MAKNKKQIASFVADKVGRDEMFDDYLEEAVEQIMDQRKALKE